MEKEYDKAVYCHPVYLTYMEGTSSEMPGWTNNLRYADNSTLMAEKWRGTKEPLDEGEREEWKNCLKLNIQKTNITAFSPITLWQIEREKVEAVTDFLFLGSKITTNGDCNHDKRHLLLRRKNMTNLNSVLKSRDTHFFDKVLKDMVFPIVMYGCESWTIKKAECQRIDAFNLWRWRRLLRVTWTARRSNQSILKEINPEYSVEGLLLKLKLQ